MSRKLIRFSFVICIFWVSISAAQVPIDGTPFWHSTELDMYSTGMTWRDCNNDGWIDVFYSNGNDIVLAENTIYLSNHGTLPNSASWSSSNYEYSGHSSVGDIDDDGWVDFAVANYLGSGGFSTANLSNVYMNNAGEISVSPDWYTGDSIYTFSCAFGDADGDGDLDLAFATGDGYNNILITDRVFYNIDGSLQTTPGWESAAGTQALDVAWGDIDNDGDLDLAYCYDDRPPALYSNISGTIETTPSWSALHNESTNTIMFGDVNGDNWLDLVVAYNNQLSGSGRFRVYFNDGTGTLNSNYGWESASGGYGSALAMCDYDNDGDNDLAAGRWFDRPRIYENIGTTFTTSPVWRGDFATVVEEMAWIDVDRNGVEQLIDTITAVTGKKLFYTRKAPIYELDSVQVDGSTLPISEFCYDPFYGWVSIGNPPTTDIVLFYQYSFTNDLTTSNWDTFNYVYPNADLAPVLFYADKSIGHAPLEVSFTDISIGATDRLWDFNDGESSSENNPAHTFTSAGVYDIRLDNVLADGAHNHTELDMVIVLGDTLYIPDLTASFGDTVICPVHLKNSFALDNFSLSLSYNGPLALQYLGFSTESCRTDYFYSVNLSAIVPSSRKLTIDFVAGVETGNPPLYPGDGPVVNLKFSPVYFSSTATIDTATVSGDTTYCKSSFFSYVPIVVPGNISTIICGDANADASVSIGDAVYLINFIFKDGLPPIPLESGDANCDNNVNIGDAIYLVNYVFRGGDAPCCP